MSIPRRFIFHANASGVTAHIRRPENRVLPVQGASSLPVTGGISESKVGAGGLGDYVRFQSAETYASGDYVDPEAAEAMTRAELPFDGAPTRTTVTARVRDLHVGKRFSVGVADAGLDSQHDPKGARERSFQLFGNRLDNIRVDGFVLKITLNEKLFNEYDTLTKLESAYAKGLPELHARMFSDPDETTRSSPLPSSNGVVYSTIVEKMEWEGKPHPAAKIDGNFLYVPDFGKVYFGAILITALSRRLTMVRIQLGSPDGGDLSASDVQDNGLTWPA